MVIQTPGPGCPSKAEMTKKQMVWEPGFRNNKFILTQFLASQQWHLERGGEAACGRLQVGSSGWAALDWRGTWWLPALLNVCGYVNFLWKFCHINFKPVLDVIEDFGIILIRHKSDG